MILLKTIILFENRRVENKSINFMSKKNVLQHCNALYNIFLYACYTKNKKYDYKF